jgi:hypothetical protein
MFNVSLLSSVKLINFYNNSVYSDKVLLCLNKVLKRFLRCVQAIQIQCMNQKEYLAKPVASCFKSQVRMRVRMRLRVFTPVLPYRDLGIFYFIMVGKRNIQISDSYLLKE